MTQKEIDKKISDNVKQIKKFEETKSWFVKSLANAAENLSDMQKKIDKLTEENNRLKHSTKTDDVEAYNEQTRPRFPEYGSEDEEDEDDGE